MVKDLKFNLFITNEGTGVPNLQKRRCQKNCDPPPYFGNKNLVSPCPTNKTHYSLDRLKCIKICLSNKVNTLWSSCDSLHFGHQFFPTIYDPQYIWDPPPSEEIVSLLIWRCTWMAVTFLGLISHIHYLSQQNSYSISHYAAL